jgi:hypothetical protein
MLQGSEEQSVPHLKLRHTAIHKPDTSLSRSSARLTTKLVELSTACFHGDQGPDTESKIYLGECHPLLQLMILDPLPRPFVPVRIKLSGIFYVKQIVQQYLILFRLCVEVSDDGRKLFASSRI